MWSKLNINIAENGNQITKILYYDTRAFRDEAAINKAVDNLLNNQLQYNAFLVDTQVDGYITKLCNEALETGRIQGNEEMKKRVLNEILLLKV